ncbi:MAG: S8 family peptidase, partial [Micrococcales bacterium]|nr:S8 family peptidase [Micrococcales bacterium]
MGVRRGALVAVVGLGLLSVVPTSASGADAGWWYDQMGVREAHAAGITGEGVKIAVLDSSINPQAASLRGANVRVADPVCLKDRDTGEFWPTTSTEYFSSVRHGTDVVGQIVGTGDGVSGIAGIAPDAQITFYATSRPEGNFEGIVDRQPCQNNILMVAVQQAIRDGNQIISISKGYQGGSRFLSAEAIRGGALIVNAVPNTQQDVNRDFRGLSAVAGVVAVGSVGPDGQPPAVGVTGAVNPTGAVVGHRRITVRAPGVDMVCQGRGESWEGTHACEGTSLATPVVTGALALVAQKYPDATSNQLLHSLLENTDRGGRGSGHDATFGFGV